MANAPEDEEPVLVAALGASAGGLEALEEFLDHMPPDTGVAFLVVQHLDPSRDSIGPELLGHHTEMPVVQAEEGDRLRPDHVHVTPPDAWISVESGRLHLEPLGDDGTPTVIDRLFRSLADDQGSGAVAILLSGAGSDGASGIGRVREAGGLTMVQDPATARFDSMPRHGISAGRVSDVLPPAELAARLAEYAERVGRAEDRAGLGEYEEPEEVFERVTELLERETGRDFSRYKPPTLLRRLARRMRMRQCDGVDEYLELLRNDPEEVQALYEDALIGVTGFFRDPDTFRVVEEDVIPRIVSGRDGGEELRIWVAGCGTGQEVYSLAMLLHRATEDLPRRPPTKIFATDVNEDALAVARRGSYPHGIAEEVPGPLLDRYFRHEQNALRVNDAIREMCIFAPHDLLADPPFSDLDLLSCRNLLIYLKPDEQDRLMPYFHYALRPGGFLLLGASESAAAHDSLFRGIEKGHRIYQRRETAGEVPKRFPDRGGGPSAVWSCRTGGDAPSPATGPRGTPDPGPGAGTSTASSGSSSRSSPLPASSSTTAGRSSTTTEGPGSTWSRPRGAPATTSSTWHGPACGITCGARSPRRPGRTIRTPPCTGPGWSWTPPTAGRRSTSRSAASTAAATTTSTSSCSRSRPRARPTTRRSCAKRRRPR